MLAPSSLNSCQSKESQHEDSLDKSTMYLSHTDAIESSHANYEQVQGRPDLLLMPFVDLARIHKIHNTTNDLDCAEKLFWCRRAGVTLREYFHLLLIPAFRVDCFVRIIKVKQRLAKELLRLRLLKRLECIFSKSSLETPHICSLIEKERPGPDDEWAVFSAIGKWSGAVKNPKIWDMGFIKQEAQVGDHIILIAGKSNPLIVRSVGDNEFVLVSPTSKMNQLMIGVHWEKRDFEMDSRTYIKIRQSSMCKIEQSSW